MRLKSYTSNSSDEGAFHLIALFLLLVVGIAIYLVINNQKQLDQLRSEVSRLKKKTEQLELKLEIMNLKSGPKDSELPEDSENSDDDLEVFH